MEPGILEVGPRAIKAAVGKTPAESSPGDRARVFRGIDANRMAERMGQPLGTVKTWVRSALKTLRDELGEAVPA